MTHFITRWDRRRQRNARRPALAPACSCNECLLEVSPRRSSLSSTSFFPSAAGRRCALPGCICRTKAAYVATAGAASPSRPADYSRAFGRSDVEETRRDETRQEERKGDETRERPRKSLHGGRAPVRPFFHLLLFTQSCSFPALASLSLPPSSLSLSRSSFSIPFVFVAHYAPFNGRAPFCRAARASGFTELRRTREIGRARRCPRNASSSPYRAGARRRVLTREKRDNAL